MLEVRLYLLLRVPGAGVLYFSTASSEIPNPAQRVREPYLPGIPLTAKRLFPFDPGFIQAIGVPQLRFGITEASSFPTESSTPLMNCTDSGAENLRAISSASLITTGRGVR